MQNDNDCAIPKLRNVMDDCEALYAHSCSRMDNGFEH